MAITEAMHARARAAGRRSLAAGPESSASARAKAGEAQTRVGAGIRAGTCRNHDKGRGQTEGLRGRWGEVQRINILISPYITATKFMISEISPIALGLHVHVAIQHAN